MRRQNQIITQTTNTAFLSGICVHFTKFGDKFGDEFVTKFDENVVMNLSQYLVSTKFVTNFCDKVM